MRGRTCVDRTGTTRCRRPLGIDGCQTGRRAQICEHHDPGQELVVAVQETPIRAAGPVRAAPDGGRRSGQPWTGAVVR
jgi:hypothetical protein